MITECQKFRHHVLSNPKSKGINSSGARIYSAQSEKWRKPSIGPWVKVRYRIVLIPALELDRLFDSSSGNPTHIKWCFSTGPYELSPCDQTWSINSNLPLTKQCGHISHNFGTSEFMTSRLLLPSLSTLCLPKPKLSMCRNSFRFLSHDSIMFHNLGNLRNEISNSYPLNCWNGEL